MYGFDGNTSALDWAIVFGLHAVSKRDQNTLVSDGYFLPTGELMINHLPDKLQATLGARAITARLIRDISDAEDATLRPLDS